MLTHGIDIGRESDSRLECTAHLASSRPSAAGSRLIPTSACHVEPPGVALSHRAWGLGSGSGLGLLEAILFLPQLSGPGAQSSVALGPGGDRAALLNNLLPCSALDGDKESTARL